MRKMRWIGFLVCSLFFCSYLLASSHLHVAAFFRWYILGKPRWLHDPYQARYAIFDLLKRKYNIQSSTNTTSYECGKITEFDFSFTCEKKCNVEEARLLTVQVYLECIKCLNEQKKERKSLSDLSITSNLLLIKISFGERDFIPYNHPYIGAVYIDQGYIECLTNLGCYGYVAEPSHIKSLKDAYHSSEKNISNDLQEAYKGLHFDSMIPPNYTNKINKDAERFQKDQSGYSSRKFILENPP